ncbi:MAG: hypothetical protein R3Y12_08175 [Clostridia bacterium]
MFNILSKFLVLLSILGIIIFPTEVILQGKEAVELAFFKIIPSLFPFFVLQSLIPSLGLDIFLSNTFGIIFKKLFKISNSSPYILGIIGGYPLGFKSVCELYLQKKISKNEAERMVCFCNNAGPAFITGFVGVFLFENKNIGYLLLLSHFLSSVILGIIFSKNAEYNINPTLQTEKNIPFNEAFINSVNSGFSSILTVCGYVIFFSVFSKILDLFNVFKTLSYVCTPILSVFSITHDEFTSLLVGCIEMTSGLNYLKTINSSVVTKIVIASFLLAFSGVSIHFQTLNFNPDLNLHKYYIAKLLQSIISPILSVLIYNFVFGKTSTVFSPSFDASYNVFDPISMYIFLAFFGINIIFAKISSK